MNDAWGWWLFFVGLGLGVAVYWLLAGRIRRSEEDLAAEERAAEAGWISELIAQGGGEAPIKLVDQILELHRRYLDGDGPVLASEEVPQPPGDVAGAKAPLAGGPASSAAESVAPGPNLTAAREQLGPDVASAGHDPDMEGDRPHREAPEAHLGQPG
jgi:hypothetical protein